jgi:RNA polymerase sigma factor (sigma-70 family)
VTDSDLPPSDAVPAVASPADVLGTVEHLFRHEAGKMVAILTRIFGLEHLTLAEDVVQDTLARALQTWPYHGIPDNPSAWIMRAARNRALDVVRREQNFREKEAEIVRVLDRPQAAPDVTDPLATEIADDCLRMMFVCCHPQVPAEAQVALALKTLCGFSVTEIARAFLTSDAAIAKRLTRAKQHIRDAAIPFEIPEGNELAARLDGVLHALYLLFNEGYKASSGDRLVREDVCREAIRLTALLAEHPAGNQPRTHALLALMFLNAARFPARVDDEGNLLRLKEQDRSRWDRSLVARGMLHLARSATGSQVSAYHLQAGIAACHTAAPSYEATNWPRILGLYDQLLEFDASPVVALNRAIVVAQVSGPRAGLAAVAAIPGRAKLEDYYLLYAVLGELESQIDDLRAAAAHFRRSLQLAELKSEQDFLARRFRDCEAALGR